MPAKRNDATRGQNGSSAAKDAANGAVELNGARRKECNGVVDEGVEVDLLNVEGQFAERVGFDPDLFDRQQICALGGFGQRPREDVLGGDLGVGDRSGEEQEKEGSVSHGYRRGGCPNSRVRPTWVNSGEHFGSSTAASLACV